MTLNDLIFQIKAEIPEVEQAEIINKLNLFILKNEISSVLPISLTANTNLVQMPDTVSYIDEIYYNNEKIEPGLTREEFLNKSYEKKEFIVLPEGSIAFGFPLLKSGSLVIYGRKKESTLDLAIDPTKDFPLPGKYFLPVLNFILKELFKSPKYQNADQFAYFEREYLESMDSLISTPAYSFRKKIGEFV